MGNRNQNHSLAQLGHSSLLQTVHDNIKDDLASNTIINHPKSAIVKHYGPNGALVANQVHTDYSQAQFDNQGSLQGGKIQLSNSTAENLLLSKSSLQFQSGKIHQASTQILDINDSTKVRKHVQTDYSQLQWDDDNQIKGGHINVSSSSPKQVKVSDGQLSYQSNKLQEGNFKTYGPDGKTVTGGNAIDYQQLQTAYHEITGGFISLKHTRTSSAKLSTASQLYYDEKGLAQKLLTSNYKTDGSTIESKVETDYNGVFFNPRHKIHLGHLVLTVKNLAGQQTSQSTMLFKDGHSLQTATITNDAQQQLKNSSLKDYSKTIFGKDGQILGGSKTLYIYHKLGYLLQANVIFYDGEGKVSRQEATIYNQDGEVLKGNLRITDANILDWKKISAAFEEIKSGLVNDIQLQVNKINKIIEEQKSLIALPNQQRTHIKKQVFKRANGTLAKEVSTVLTSANVPIASLFTYYKAD